jgi:hypothetical protein
MGPDAAPRIVTYFEPVPPRLARNVIESTTSAAAPLHDARRT